MWTSLQILAGVLVGLEAASLIQPEWGYYFEQDDQGPGTYSFSYDIEDPGSLNVQFKRERRLPNGTVTGSYGLVEPDGNIRIVHYTADSLGYRAVVENSKKPNEAYPPQPVMPSPWSRRPYWGLLWDQPQSQPLQYAVQNQITLGNPVQEQRTPPAASADQQWDSSGVLTTVDRDNSLETQNLNDQPSSGSSQDDHEYLTQSDQSPSYPVFVLPYDQYQRRL